MPKRKTDHSVGNKSIKRPPDPLGQYRTMINIENVHYTDDITKYACVL